MWLSERELLSLSNCRHSCILSRFKRENKLIGPDLHSFITLLELSLRKMFSFFREKYMISNLLGVSFIELSC